MGMIDDTTRNGREKELEGLRTRCDFHFSEPEDGGMRAIAAEICALNHTMTRILHLLEDRLGGGK